LVILDGIVVSLPGNLPVFNGGVLREAYNMNRQTPHEPEFKLEGPNTLWLIPIEAKKSWAAMKLTRLE
jgi:hypothetical protein